MNVLMDCVLDLHLCSQQSDRKSYLAVNDLQCHQARFAVLAAGWSMDPTLVQEKMA